VRVGISTYRDVAHWGVWESRADVLHAAYADAVARAGAVPLLLSCGAAQVPAAAGLVLGSIDGLVLSGGADVDPRRYGAQAHPLSAAHPDRDEWELQLLRHALSMGVPVLAICRGMQLLNVALGGDLHQHLSDLDATEDHAAGPGRFRRHTVRTSDGSRIEAACGPRPQVSCHHHQAGARLGRGLLPTAHAADGTVEAIELTGPTWVVGVQWHPEADDDGSLFDTFVNACRKTIEHKETAS
jgi:gamma-glutamyl-gamma-aminobutyrate hydrolase PuuD